jgi:type IV fimbrial biogenesis protein FimT
MSNPVIHALPRASAKRASRARNRGVSLIEIAIGLLVIAVLMKMVVPSFRTWIQNTQVRNTAQAIASGMSIARGEAVKRNVEVQFALTTDASGGAPGWSVALVSAPNTALQSWSAAEGAPNALITQGTGGIVTFNGAGRITSPNTSDGSAPMLVVDVSNTTAATDQAVRPLRVVVGAGGMARVCDPALAQPDPRAC